MRIYLDLCCLNRPFHDQTQLRISLETQALNVLLERIAQGEDRLVGSDALTAENDQNTNVDHRTPVENILRRTRDWIVDNDEIVARRKELTALGFRPFDAYHVAMAEAGACDRLVTCDDQFLKVARRNADGIRVKVTDPLSLA